MAVKGTRKRSDYESDDDISAVSQPSKISCFEKGCYVDEKTSAENGGYMNVERDYSDDDEVDCVEEERMAKRRRYANDDYTDDEANYGGSWDKECSTDDHKGVFFEQECSSCEKGGNVITGYEADDSDEESSGDQKARHVDEECSSCEKGGNVTGYEADDSDEESSTGDQTACYVDQDCSYEKSCRVSGEFNDNEGCYWDEFSCRYTNDRAIYCSEGWFLGWRA